MVLKKEYTCVKKDKIIIIILLIIIMLNICNNNNYVNAKKEEVKMINIMFWNIFEGGQSKMKNIKQYIQQQDIVTFSELNHWNEETFHEYFKDTHPYSIFLKTKTGYHLGCISKQPIEEIKKSIEIPMHHGYIYFQSYNYNILLTHLSPHSSVVRLKEVQHLNALTRKYNVTTDKQLPLLMMGDMNTLSTVDKYEEEIISKLFNNKLTRRKFFNNNNNDDDKTPDYAPYKYIVNNNNMYDTGTSNDYTVPTPVNTDFMHAAKLRLDYIFCSNTFYLNNNDKRSHDDVMIHSIVHKNNVVEKLSDHYPISISLPLHDNRIESYKSDL